MPTAIESLLSILDLETLEENLFQGVSPPFGWQRVFGGQVIGQALVAACRTVGERPVHSLHAYFLRAGDPKIPIIYEVERIRDGSSFSTRRVVAIQHGHAIFSMSASFHAPEDGFEHQEPMPSQVPPPDALASEDELVRATLSQPIPGAIRRYLERERPIELRPVHPRDPFDPRPGEPVQHIWFRATGPVAENGPLNQCVLAYATDFTLLDTALIPHGRSIFDKGLMVASLDHALWFHRPFRADEWLLYVQESTNARSARGLTRGAVYARDGRLIASVVQEGLIRQRTR